MNGPTARLGRLPPYPLSDMRELKAELVAKGKDVIDLGAGDADLAPPPAAVDALAAAAARPEMSRYGFQQGLSSFRQAIASWMERRFGVRLDPVAEIQPLLGSKEGLANLAHCFVESGDRTIVPEPAYMTYAAGTILADGEPYAVPLLAENDFLLQFDDVPAAVAARSRILYLNYPNNPTAAIAPRDYLERAVAFCHRHDLVLCYDNAYSEIAFDGYRPPSILEIDGAREVAIEFHSFSKTYNMTGWRIGWAAGSAGIVGTLRRLKTYSDTGPFLAVQAAAQAALETYDDWVPGNVAAFRERRDAAAAALEANGFEVPLPRATMYLWIPAPAGGSQRFARRALSEEGVVVMPGGALAPASDGFFRVALTQPPARLEEAAARLGRLRRNRVVGTG